ncbi:MAG: hypothetical protein A3I78_02865 [Gammaproteobacteria bacterium RIFCSPLOWO2_02_FULL_56_15]|nr:MAG: hypothetical protein A3I78_02865 [Gammaproteobacteria bacterium RIFCSPLOWO2_02_FULL_56_15]
MLEARAGSGGVRYSPGYCNYVLGVLCLGYVFNSMDRSVLGVLLESIKEQFNASDTALGLLGGISFALFYAVMGIPLAALADRFNRRNLLAICISAWSLMTALCGAATSFLILLLARIGTAVGESGGSPPSHSLIADYFPVSRRATALSVYALAIPIGGALGIFLGGWFNEFYGWRMAFFLVGLPGILVGLLVRYTVQEPPRGHADQASADMAAAKAPQLLEALKFLWSRKSFRHLTMAAGTHSFVWYSGSNWNAAFFMRSHDLGSGETGTYLSIFQFIGIIGTFLGGYLSDRISTRRNDRRWYLWVPGIACLVMVPLQWVAYLSPNLSLVMALFAVLMILASLFFGPSFAMTQALATLRTRAVAISILLFMQTLIGMGLGPLFVGMISDALESTAGDDSLSFAMAIVGFFNVWAALHYFLGARVLRQDLAATEALLKSVAEPGEPR